MASNHIGRINEEIQRELSALIPAVKDPRVSGMISVTAVDPLSHYEHKMLVSRRLSDNRNEAAQHMGIHHLIPPDVNTLHSTIFFQSCVYL